MMRAIDNISASVTRARHKLCDHIDACAIEDERFEINQSTIDLCALVEYAIRGFSSSQRERIKVACGAPMSAFVDAVRVERVISHFVELALCASQPDHRISVSVERRGERAALVITTGGTLPSSVLRFAFEQARASLAHGFRGSRGLFVARHAIEAHGGTVSLLAQPEHQMAIVIDLPLPLPPPVKRRERAHQGTSVLVVDDNADQLEALVRLLRLDGFDAGCAATGSEALASLMISTADVLLVDVQLPDMKAADLIFQARARMPQLPAVVMTGYPREHPAVATALQAAYTRYVPKPLNLRVLYRELGRALEVRAP